MTLSSALRFFYTVRYLKFRQFFFRFFYRVYNRRIPKKLISVNIREARFQIKEFLYHEECLVGPREFFFLNKRGSLDHLGWQGDEVSKLWRYNQHYFDFLKSNQSTEYADWNTHLMLDWVENNKPGYGVGWEPYPTSLRIVNWVKWALSGNKLPDEFVKSLAIQTAWLSSRVEFHILGNHLFSNAKALVYAGLFFEGEQSNQWLKKGLNLISAEMNEQVLPDGGHFELSPLYHEIFLEDILDLINISEIFPGFVNPKIIDTWKSTAVNMIGWLGVMTHPDGEIALFNDSAFKIAPKPEQLFEYAKRLSIHSKEPQEISEMTHLSESGYIRVKKNELVMIVDVAKVGPDYLPGHAHADTLSFELSLHGLRLFVNGGTSEYGTGEIRQYERSTAAHNTVVIDNENSSEVWSGFRVARRAYPFNLKMKKTEDGVHIECSHNGYKRFNKDLVHTRTWNVSNNCLDISDKVKGRHNMAFAYYHLNTDIKILSHDAYEIILSMKNGKRVRLNYRGSSIEVIDGFYAPEFGKRIPNQCLKIGLDKLDGASLQVAWDS